MQRSKYDLPAIVLCWVQSRVVMNKYEYKKKDNLAESSVVYFLYVFSARLSVWWIFFSYFIAVQVYIWTRKRENWVLWSINCICLGAQPFIPAVFRLDLTALHWRLEISWEPSTLYCYTGFQKKRPVRIPFSKVFFFWICSSVNRRATAS